MTPIDEYLHNVPQPQKSILEHIRAVVLQVVPEATQTISYGMPVMKYKGKYLIGFSPFKDHLSIFPGSSPVAELEAKLDGFKMSKGTIQFTVDKQIPDALLREIIQHSAATIARQ